MPTDSNNARAIGEVFTEVKRELDAKSETKFTGSYTLTFNYQDGRLMDDERTVKTRTKRGR